MSSLFSSIYDSAMRPIEWAGLGKLRQEIVSHAQGLILEIGIGTGLNIPYYKRGRVTGMDPDVFMLEKARARAVQANAPVSLVCGCAEALPFPDGIFQTVVSTLVFCTVADPCASFHQLRRVLKPSGKLLMLEHVRGRSPLLARVQDSFTPIWKKVAGGCHLNRVTLQFAQQCGWQVENAQTSLNGALIRATLRPA